MSATMTAPEQVDGLEKLLTLATLKKEDIVATHTALREQMQLTDAERGKVAEAKSYIKQYETLAANISQRETDLASSRLAYEAEAEKFRKFVEDETKRLNDLSVKWAEKLAEQEAMSAKLIADEKRIAEAKAVNDRGIRDSMVNVRNAELANAETARNLQAEDQRLKDWEAVLKGKAQRIKLEAANF